MTPSKSLVFFGNERLSTGLESTDAPTLKALVANGYEVRAVVSNFEPGRSRTSRPLEIEAVAKQHSIPMLLPRTAGEIVEAVTSLKAEFGVLVAYGRIIPQDIIDLFPKGILNIHPSLLPKLRGPTPVEGAILTGATETGVSIMKLSATMDAGPVYAQETLPLKGNEQKQDLAARLLVKGAELLTRTLPGIIDGSATATPQNEDEATYTKLISKADGEIEWLDPATLIEREVRAFLGWPGSYTKLGGVEVTVKEAEVIAEQGPAGTPYRTKDKQLAVYCGEDALVIKTLRPAGKSNMSGAAFLAGYGGVF